MYEFFLADSLEKVFADTRPRPMLDCEIKSLQGARFAFQLVYHAQPFSDCDWMQRFTVSVSGAPGKVRIREVGLVPSDLPALDQRDCGYLRTAPGLYPDVLLPYDGYIRPIPGQWRSLFIDFVVDADARGLYDLTVTLEPEATSRLGNGQLVQRRAGVDVCKLNLCMDVVTAKLPKQTLLVTQWFHADCLANYYHCEVFSEHYWQILDSFITFAAQEAGMNMLLTPIFTPPLDTRSGGERTTVQLVGINREGDRYTFDWKHLRRWCALCKKAGIEHLEMAHLFTQWGALFTPKIVATVDGMEEKIFGWHVSATDPRYRTFLEQFIPSLRTVLEQEGFGSDRIRFHISDEPNLDQLSDYLKAKAQVVDLLDGCIVMDALSNFEFYADKVVEHPVCASDHIKPFLDNNVANLWVYYCVAQGVKVPNRFFSMPSSRNRIMGILMYLYNIEGFLHWGYNFYNSQYSVEAIDPYRVTDCRLAFPSGDAFIVYPGKDYAPLSSLRNEVQVHGFEDMQCLMLLEELTSRDFVDALLHEHLSYRLSFDRYPLDACYLLQVRNRCLEEIKKHL
ncbi:DUF4091 domain-containing protein [Sphaerochaeta sp.]|uniref:DUF4091 domain-containing protein n=1 Tax=Sphaerochaeta sp. TaxID=1972642 RepID=UPI0025865249|nr:DUF4091 domain-containing protein [Sphaerochaeta sp.]MDD3457256.1 DUF4091 domain-containing protein [Sphaerochaeta sp.]MDD4039002.1 DUF4091 domain-containing protein [Sphaerochaeta sp.]